MSFCGCVLCLFGSDIACPLTTRECCPDDGPDDAKKGRRRLRHTGPTNRCQRGRISNLKMGRTDRGFMELLTSKQAAQRPADGGADGKCAARLGCEQNDSPDFSWMLIEWFS